MTIRSNVHFAFMSVAFLAGCAEQSAVVLDDSPAPEPAIARALPQALPQPAEQIVEIGRSIEGRPIEMHLLGFSPNPALVIGGIHGSEKNSSDCALLLLEHLRQHPGDLGRGSIAVIPEANPDGLARNLRYNAHRVDLNRNFPSQNWSKAQGIFASGPKPSSEPETRALCGVMEKLQPRRILSIHSIVGDPCNNYDGPAETVANRMAMKNGYPIKAAIGYPTPGSLGSWAGLDRKIPTITLELSRATFGAVGWQQNREAILAFLNFSN
jgi:protein MpaA